ncbi:MAG TPA: hypothetical protein DDZ51_00125 [Planctomycetaceae bacterium]|nr:hypothetical protein [Planctomycetaceae bacterium]
MIPGATTLIGKESAQCFGSILLSSWIVLFECTPFRAFAVLTEVLWQCNWELLRRPALTTCRPPRLALIAA